MSEWKYDSIGNIILTFKGNKTVYLQGDDVQYFLEEEGISKDDQNWGEGDFNDYGDYESLAE